MLQVLKQKMYKMMVRKIIRNNMWQNCPSIVQRVTMLIPKEHKQFVEWIPLCEYMNIQPPLAAPGTCSHPLTFKLFFHLITDNCKQEKK